jgi:hypothetical protein
VRQSLAILTAALVAAGTLACSREPSPEERLARGRELVQRMSDQLARTTAFRVVSRETRERVKRDGNKKPLSIERTTIVRRPDRLHSRASGDVNTELVYDGVGITFISHKDKVFGQSRMPETLDRMLDALADRYGVSMPLADLAYSSAADALLTDATKGGWVGVGDVDGRRAHHLAFTDHGVAWDLWLPVEGDPLPLRMRVVKTGRKGQPATDVRFLEWDLVAKPEAVVFEPAVPGDYEGIALIQHVRVLQNRPAPAPASAVR